MNYRQQAQTFTITTPKKTKPEFFIPKVLYPKPEYI